MSEIQPTKPLYYGDPYMKEFHARILQITKLDNRFGIVLDQTEFYRQEADNQQTRES